MRKRALLQDAREKFEPTQKEAGLFFDKRLFWPRGLLRSSLADSEAQLARVRFKAALMGEVLKRKVVEGEKGRRS